MAKGWGHTWSFRPQMPGNVGLRGKIEVACAPPRLRLGMATTPISAAIVAEIASVANPSPSPPPESMIFEKSTPRFVPGSRRRSLLAFAGKVRHAAHLLLLSILSQEAILYVIQWKGE